MVVTSAIQRTSRRHDEDLASMSIDAVMRAVKLLAWFAPVDNDSEALHVVDGHTGVMKKHHDGAKSAMSLALVVVGRRAGTS